jgi:hypothetical protein
MKQFQDQAKVLHSQILAELSGKTLSPIEQASTEQIMARLEKLSGAKLAEVSWADAVLTSTNGTNAPVGKYLVRASF